MAQNSMISIAYDFSPVPAGRYVTDGPYSGERFRDEVLRPRLGDSDQVIVNLDGVEGFGSSFLEEVFGGLVRKKYFTAEELKKKLSIESRDLSYVEEIWQYINEGSKLR